MSQVVRSNILKVDKPSFQTVIVRVAAILLCYAANDIAAKPGLSQREMALLIGTSWEQINSSLRYLREEGAISINRHRIIIKESSLRKIAGGYI